MFVEFAGMQLSREELRELQQALLTRAMLEDNLRAETAQEPVEHRLLERIDDLLGEPAETREKQNLQAEEELWEHAWYTFTDEWAWYRARQDVDAEVEKQKTTLTEAERLSRTESRYQKKFEAYVSEVDMLGGAPKEKRKTTQAKGK